MTSGLAQAVASQKTCIFHFQPYLVVPMSQSCPLHPNDSRLGLTGTNPTQTNLMLNSKQSVSSSAGSASTNSVPNYWDDHVDSSSCYHIIPIEDNN